MPAAKATERDLKSQLRELSERHRHLKEPELFVVWFLIAFVTENEPAALDGLAGGSNDKSVDALVIDDDAGVVTLVQGKLRFPVGSKSENRNDYNNGITVICDEAEQVRTRGDDVIQAQNPQVINGQQTTRTLARSARNRKASVLVRVIRVPRVAEHNHGHFDKLVSAIVGATNFQNAVVPSDLMSNDRRQIEIERQLRKLDYGYVRKRQTKGEARRSLGLFRRLIKKDELARAVAACELDPLVVREGKEGLFEEHYYKHVFPTSEPYFYLARYWLMREVSGAARHYPERAYAKWLVLHAVWDHMRRVLDGRHSREAFRSAWEKNWKPVLRPLHRANDAMFRAASQFYRARRGKGPKALDPSTFFKRRDLHRQFARFWRGSSNSHRARFNRAWARFQRELSKVAEERK